LIDRRTPLMILVALKFGFVVSNDVAGRIFFGPALSGRIP
jgi:hypothetical protein